MPIRHLLTIMLKCILSYFYLLIACISFAQDAQHTTLLGHWSQSDLRNQSGLIFNDIWGYVDSEMNEYGIIGSVDYTHFIDLNDPTNPTQVAQIAAPSGSVWRDFKTYLHYAYGVSDNGGGTLQIFDLSNLPHSVTKVYDSNAFFSNCHNIFIDEKNARLYAVGTNQANLVVLDLQANPAQPTLLKNLGNPPIEGYIHDIYVRNHIGYASHVYSSKLSVYNLENLDEVTKLGTIGSYGLNHSSWLTKDGNTLIMADENHGLALNVVNTSNLSSMEIIGNIKSNLESAVSTASIAHNPFIIGNDYVVIAYYHEGIQIYNITDPKNPTKAGYYDTYPQNSDYPGYSGSWGVYPFLPSGNIIASDTENGLFVIRPTFDMGYCRAELYHAKPVKTGETTHIFSTKSISLRNDFQVELGGNFSAKIVACQTSYQSNSPPNSFPKEQVIGGGNFENRKLIINELNKISPKVFPNPFHQKFNLSLPESSTNFSPKIQLRNQLGQLMSTQISTCGSNCFSIKTNALAKGIYTVLMERKNGEIVTKKIVKF